MFFAERFGLFRKIKMSKATYSATMVLVCFTLVACDGVDLGVEGPDSGNPDGSQSLVTNNNAEGLEDARFGDEYWACLLYTSPSPRDS